MGNEIRADGKREKAVAQRLRIDISQDDECRDWAERFNVPEKTLRDVVAKVGPMADDIRRGLDQRHT